MLASLAAAQQRLLEPAGVVEHAEAAQAQLAVRQRMRRVALQLGDLFFFFKRKPAYELSECDWSSDVCSSDLEPRPLRQRQGSPGPAGPLPAPAEEKRV